MAEIIDINERRPNPVNQNRHDDAGGMFCVDVKGMGTKINIRFYARSTSHASTIIKELLGIDLVFD